MYRNLSKICPWVMMNLSGSSKRGVGIFLRVVIFVLKIHIVSLAIFMYAHSATSVLLACTVAWVYFREKSTFTFERLWKDGVHLDVSHCFVQVGQALRLNQKRYGECGRTL